MNPEKISIEIFDEITESTFKDVLRRTESLPDGSDVELKIASYGGEILYTFSIIDALKRFHTHSNVIGFACSAAAILAIACDECTMSENASLMLHSAWAHCATIDDVEKMDPGIKRCNQLQMDIISKRCPEYDAEMLKTDTWLSAEQCLKLHLADNIYNSEAIDYAAVAKRYAAKLSIKCQKEIDAMDENVKEVIEEVKEEEREAAPEAEEAPAEENHDLVEVIEKLSEEINALKARVMALEEMGKPAEEDEPKAEAGCEDDEQRRINAIYHNIVAPQAKVAIGVPKAAIQKIQKVDYKKFKNFING